MKKFDAKKELDKLEKELWRVGTRLSKPFIKRAKELIVELGNFKGVKLERLCMGMGTYSLVGTLPFKEVWQGGVEEGDHELELWLQFDTGRNCWMEYYEVVNPGICKVCTELNELLSTLTHTSYLDIFDIDEEEMKKLLTRGKKRIS